MKCISKNGIEQAFPFLGFGMDDDDDDDDHDDHDDDDYGDDGAVVVPQPTALL